MGHPWDEEIAAFIHQCTVHEVRMVMVGGGAVNFHGYQRHSADVDFWIDCTRDNLLSLADALKAVGFEVTEFPSEVVAGEKNISLKFSPDSLYVELITRFSSSLTFEEAYEEAERVEVEGMHFMHWRVLSLKHLIDSKLKSARPKDLLDVQELVRRNKMKD